MDLRQLKMIINFQRDSRKMLLKNYIKKNDFKWAAENRDKILEKWEKRVWPKKQNRKK